MPLGKAALAQRFQHVLGQLQEPQLVRHGRLRFAQAARGLLLAHAEHADQLPDAVGLLEKVEVAALQVFHQRDQARVLHVHVQQHAGHLAQARQPRRAQPPLARHELIAPRAPPHRQRVQDAVAADALGKLGERGVVKDRARLDRVGCDLVDS